MKIFADLTGRQGMQMQIQRPSSQEVSSSPLQLAGTGAGKNKAKIFVLNALLDIIEERGNFLDLIHNDKGFFRQNGDSFPKMTGRMAEIKLNFRIQEIDK